MVNVQASCKTLPLNFTEKCIGTNIFVPYGKHYNLGLEGQYMWTDGTDLYFSNDVQYKLNKETNTWESITWNGDNLPQMGNYIWSDGDSIYYHNKYKLNKETNTWESISWNVTFDGRYVWTDGINIYYSNSTTQYKLNKETNTWETWTWNGATVVDTYYLWTDGTSIYHNGNGRNYKLNKETNTWETWTWNGNGGCWGTNVWSDSTNIYFNSGGVTYKLNKETNTWETWGGNIPYRPENTWTDGKNVYFSDSGETYLMLPITAKLYSYDGEDWNELIAFSNGISFTINGVKYYAEKGMNWWTWVDSEYNTDGYVIDETEGVLWYGTECQVLYQGNTILGSTEIVNGRAYDHNSG